MDMKSLVTFRKCESYDQSRLRDAVLKALNDVGGVESFLKTGDRVLLKPNLLMSAQPERAVVTHPAFVEAVAALLADCGGKLFLGDSPPMGRLSRTLSKSGYDPFMKRMDIQTVPFTAKITAEFSDGKLFRKIDLAGEVFEFDVVINLPKLKTHSQMVLTLAVKNLFGTIIGADKAAWHLRAGKDFDSFATVLVQVLEKVRPAVSIIDGILGMEGNGPNNGAPRHIGIIGASTDAVALDAEICRIVGIPVDRVRTCVIGQKLGIGKAESGYIERVGDEVTGSPLRDFKAPKSTSMAWNLPSGSRLRKFLENHFITRPDIDSTLCQKCGICMSHCPPQAISERGGTMFIDRQKCISCFCCHELCPNNAVEISQPFLGRCLSAISR